MDGSDDDSCLGARNAIEPSSSAEPWTTRARRQRCTSAEGLCGCLARRSDRVPALSATACLRGP